MRIGSIIAFAVLFSLTSHGQITNKQDYIWLFSNESDKYLFDFNETYFEPKSYDHALDMDSNNASISDQNGNLLFYTNGCAVANAHQQIMPNGDSINYSQWLEDFWQGDCGYGYPGFQDVMILQDPGYDDGYYIIHKMNIRREPYPKAFRIMMKSYVDMQMDGGKGDLVYKNDTIYNGSDKLMFSYLTAIRHVNKKD